jgi:hypothetical protein
MTNLNLGRPPQPSPSHAIEIKKFVWEEKERGGGRINNITLLRYQIVEKYNVALSWKQVEQIGESLKNESDVHRTKKGKKKPNWTPEEANYAAKLFLELPSRANSEVWNTLISELNDTFHKGVAIRSKKAVDQKMNKLGIKRTNTTTSNPIKQTFEYYEKVLLEVGLKLIKWESGITKWKIECLNCGEIYIKKAIYNATDYRHNNTAITSQAVSGCKFCIGDPNGYAEAYLTKIFCEKSGAHSKFGLSKNPSNRIASFGSTLTDTTWPNLTNSIVRKIEDKVAEKFGDYKTFPEELIGNGYTECYHTLVHEQIREYVYQLLLDAKSQIPIGK